MSDGAQQPRPPAGASGGAGDPIDAAGNAPGASDAVDAVIDEVPRLPRGRGLKLSRPQLIRIAGTLALLVFVVVVQRPCSDSVSKLVTGFGDQGSAAAAMPRPDNVDLPSGSAGDGSAGGAGAAGRPPELGDYERLRPGMTDDEVRAVIERARARAAGSGQH